MKRNGALTPWFSAVDRMIRFTGPGASDREAAKSAIGRKGIVRAGMGSPFRSELARGPIVR
jgi:hypothetical protein